MLAKKVLLAAAFLTAALFVAPSWAASINTQRSEATASYDRGDYSAAFKKYLKLGKKGDTFSQYRVSYMNLKGLGTKEDMVEAVAWAVLAAEHGHDDLERYQDVVAALVPPDDRKKAQSKADYYVRRWGREDDEEAGAPERSSGGRCTGSRLSATCNDAAGSGSGTWIAWGAVDAPPEELRNRVEELNRAIVENAPAIGVAKSSGR